MIMLKQLLTTAGLCILCSSALAEGQNYTLTIEGKTYDAAPGEIVHAKLKSGVDVDIAFERKAFGTFNNDGFSFEYPSAMAVAETEIDNFDKYTEMSRKTMADKQLQKIMRGYHDIVSEGRREIYMIEK